MISSVNPSYSDQITAEGEAIDQYVDNEVKADTETKIKQLQNLLIEYILAEEAKDAEAAKGIAAQIGKLVDSVGDEVKDGNAFEAKIKAIMNDPNAQTEEKVEELQKILDSLKNGESFSGINI